MNTAAQTRNTNTQQTPSPWIDVETNYLWVPKRLLEHLHSTPLAIALYTIIARLWKLDTYPNGIPLSDADIQRFCPSLSRSQIRTARARLLEDHWIVAAQHGRKLCYTPTWGQVNGVVQPWTRGNKWGRGHVKTIRVSHDLIDLFVGRLIVHSTDKAVVQRYIERPLSACAIGTYVLAKHIQVESLAELENARLMANGTALPIPEWSEVLTRTPCTERGIQRLLQFITSNITNEGAAPQRTQQFSPALFFFKLNMVIVMVSHLAMLLLGSEEGNSQLEREESQIPQAHPTATGMSCMVGNIMESSMAEMEQKTNREEASLTADRNTNELNSHSKQKDAATNYMPQMTDGHYIMSNEFDSSTKQALAAIGVRPKQQRELAALELTWVECVITNACQRPEVHDIAGWVVAVLRDVRDHGWDWTTKRWKVEPPAALVMDDRMKKFEAFMRGEYGCAAMADHDAHASAHADHPDDVMMAERIKKFEAQFLHSALPDDGCQPDAATSTPMNTALAAADTTDHTLVESTLEPPSPHTPCSVVDAEQMNQGTGRAVINAQRAACADGSQPAPSLAPRDKPYGADRDEDSRRPVLVTGSIQPSDGGNLRVERARPAWIPAQLWVQLPPILRGLLSHAKRDGTDVVAQTPWQQRKLHDCYGEQLQALLQHIDALAA